MEKDKSYDVSMRDWGWPQGVALFAMYQYYVIKREPELLKYLEDWFAEHFEAGLPPVDVNSTCPMLTLTYLYEETGNPEYKRQLDNGATKLPHIFHGQKKADSHIISLRFQMRASFGMTLCI